MAADAPETQVIESRRAFVSGACALFWLVMKTSEVSDNEGLAIMDAIHKEIDDFRKEAFTEFLKSRPVGGHG